MAEETNWLDDMTAQPGANSDVAEDAHDELEQAPEVEAPKQETEQADASTPAVSDAGSDVQASTSKPPEAPTEPPAKPELNEAAQAAIAERRRWQERQAELQSRYEAQQREVAELKAKVDALTRPQEPAKKAPTYEEDPAEYLRAQTEHANRVAQDATERAQRIEAENARQKWMAQEVQAITSEEQAFMAQAPDYREAISFVRRSDQARLSFLPDTQISQMIRHHGYEPVGGREQQISQLMGLNELALAISLRRSGTNPAEAFYNMAKTTGYTPRTAPVAESATPKADLTTIQQGLKEARGSSARGPVETGEGDDFFSELFGAR